MEATDRSPRHGEICNAGALTWLEAAAKAFAGPARFLARRLAGDYPQRAVLVAGGGYPIPSITAPTWDLEPALRRYTR